MLLLTLSPEKQMYHHFLSLKCFPVSQILFHLRSTKQFAGTNRGTSRLVLTGNSRGQQVLCWEGWQLPPGDEAQRGRQPQCGRQQSTGEGQMVPSARDPRGGLLKICKDGKERIRTGRTERFIPGGARCFVEESRGNMTELYKNRGQLR